MIAVFDLDHTLISANSSYCFGAFLFKRRKISLLTALTLMFAYGLHKLNRLSLESLHQIAFRMIFAQKSAHEIHALTEVFLDAQLESLIKLEVLNRLQHLKDQNSTLFLYSSSPDFLVNPIAKRLGISETLSSQYLVDKEGKFDRILLLVNGDEKKKQLQAILDKRVDKTEFTTAFSDSILDAPLLLKVDKPVCVNPDKKLRKLAEHHRWEIIEDGCSI